MGIYPQFQGHYNDLCKCCVHDVESVIQIHFCISASHFLAGLRASTLAPLFISEHLPLIFTITFSTFYTLTTTQLLTTYIDVLNICII